MEVFEGMTLEGFKEDFNRKMDMLAMSDKKVGAPDIDISALRGCVLYEETWRQPESLRDHFDLANMRVTCGQCKEFRSTKYSWGECNYCRGDLRKADEPCERFWKEWERGNCFLEEKERETYYEVEDKFRRTRLRCVQGRDAV